MLLKIVSNVAGVLALVAMLTGNHILALALIIVWVTLAVQEKKVRPKTNNTPRARVLRLRTKRQQKHLPD